MQSLMIWFFIFYNEFDNEIQDGIVQKLIKIDYIQMKPVLYAKKMTSKRKMLPIHVHVGLGQCLIMQSFTDTYYKYNKLPFMYNMNNVGCSFCKIFFKSLPCKMN